MRRTLSGERATAYLGLVLTAIFWAGNAVIARAVAHEIGAFTLAFGRWIGALLILLPFAIPHLRRAAPVVRANLAPLFWLGLLGVGTFNTLLYLAAHTTTALNITLVNSTIPVVIAVLGHFVLGHRTTRGQVVGFLLAAAGMLAIVTRGEWGVLAGFAFREGDLVMIVAVIVWGIYSVLLRVWRLEIHPLGFLTLTVIVGVAVLAPPFLWELSIRGGPAFRGEYVAIFAYLAIFPSVLAYLFWNRAVAVVGPGITAMFIYLVPLFTAGLAYAFLDEELRGYHAAGAVLILVGLYLAIRPTPPPSLHRIAPR